MSGGRAGVVFEETLGGTFSPLIPHSDSLDSVPAHPELGHPPPRRSATQGFAKDHIGTAATREALQFGFWITESLLDKLLSNADGKIHIITCTRAQGDPAMI